MEKKKLQCVDLTYGIGGRTILRGLSFTLQAGEIAWLRGANGAGKSTLLRLISGAIMPDDGQILWDGASADMLYIGHRAGIFPSLRVHEILTFWASLHDTHALVNAAIHYFELEPFLEFRVSELSAGWRQKLVLCRLILQPAALWLLDEPANNLDTDAVELLQSLVQSRKEQGGIILLAMHGQVQNDHIRTIDLSSQLVQREE